MRANSQVDVKPRSYRDAIQNTFAGWVAASGSVLKRQSYGCRLSCYAEYLALSVCKTKLRCALHQQAWPGTNALSSVMPHRCSHVMGTCKGNLQAEPGLWGRSHVITQPSGYDHSVSSS